MWDYWGPCAGSVWGCGRSLSGVSVGLTHSLRGTLHCCPFCTSRQEKGKGLSTSASLLFCQRPSASLLQTGTLVPAPPTQHSPLGASERTWHEAGSGAVICAPLCELWGALNGLGHTPSLRPWLSLHARHGGCGAEAGRPRERTQHKQARVLCPHSPGPGPTCGGPDRHGGGAIPAGS